MTLGDWLEDNPKARPLLMFGLFAVVLLMVGVLLGLSKKRKEPLVGDLTKMVANHPPDPGKTTVPTGSGEEQLNQPAQSRKVAWITEKDAEARLQPGLNLPVVRKYQQWDEVSWIREEDNWDQVRGSDGQELWVRSKFITFTKPSNLDKPSEAEVTVMAFYDAVQRKDYAAAYNYLAPPWKAELDFNHFVEGYSRTNSLRTELSRVVPLGPNRFQVDVTMDAVELDKHVPYAGSYVVEKTEDHWDMTSGSLNRLASRDREPPPAVRIGPDTANPPSPPPPAPAVTPTPRLGAPSPASEDAPSSSATGF